MSTPNEDSLLTVATWNIHCGRDRRGEPFDYSSQVSMTGADIVGLQEVEIYGLLNGSAAKEVFRNDGYQHATAQIFSASPFDDSAGLAVAILSSVEIGHSAKTVLSNPIRAMNIEPAFHDKGIITSQISWIGSVIDIVALHLFPFHRVGMDDRDPSLEIVWRELDELLTPRANVPRIVLGDFNTPHRAQLLDCIRLGHLNSTFLDLPSRDSGESHDDILVSPEWTLKKRESLHTESDHNLLIASFSLDSNY
jgi:endonuclease/exonuclease/phosphatase family metal-dependent hydrolase